MHHAITTTIIIVIRVTLPIRNGSEQTRAFHIVQEMGQVMEDQWVNIIQVGLHVRHVMRSVVGAKAVVLIAMLAHLATIY